MYVSKALGSQIWMKKKKKKQAHIEGNLRKETFKQNQDWGRGLGGWNCWIGEKE